MSVRYPSFDSLTTEECISKIIVMENKLGKDGLIFGIVDKDGNVFASNEDKKVYTLGDLKVDEIEEKTLEILKPVKDSDIEYMTFIMKNEMPVTLGDGRIITHTIVFWEMDYYKKIFHNEAKHTNKQKNYKELRLELPGYIAVLLKDDISKTPINNIDAYSYDGTKMWNIREILESMKDMKIIGDTVTITSAPKNKDYEKLEKLASDIMNSL